MSCKVMLSCFDPYVLVMMMGLQISWALKKVSEKLYAMYKTHYGSSMFKEGMDSSFCCSSSMLKLFQLIIQSDLINTHISKDFITYTFTNNM